MKKKRSLNEITIDSIKPPIKKNITIKKSIQEKENSIIKNKIKNKEIKGLDGSRKKERFTYRTSKEILNLLRLIEKKTGLKKNQICDMGILNIAKKLNINI